MKQFVIYAVPLFVILLLCDSSLPKALLAAMISGSVAILVDWLDHKLFGARLEEAEKRMKQTVKEIQAAKTRGERPKKRIQIVR